MTLTRSQRLAEAAADRAAARAARARPGQRIRLQTIHQHLRLKALIAGIKVKRRTG